MIDVHVPHKTEHTWTDFFIHIATIIAGLIIAIGLEQTVEAVHHLNRRAFPDHKPPALDVPPTEESTHL